MLLVLCSCGDRSERVDTYEKGDTIFIKDSYDKNGKPEIYGIIGQNLKKYVKDESIDSILIGNQELNEDVSYRFIKTKTGLVKDEVFIVGKTTGEFFFVAFENDTIKCGEDLIVRVNVGSGNKIDFDYGGKHYLSEKLGNPFKLKVKTFCKNKGVQTFNAKLDYTVEGFEGGDADIEFNYFVK